MADDAVEAEMPVQYQPDWPRLKTSETEGPFMTAGVELFKEAATLAMLAAGVYSARPFDRDEAIRCALLVRAGRLARTTLRDTCDGDGEQQLALFRQFMDTVCTLRYLVDDVDGSRHSAYVQNSLVAEREFLKTIEQQQKTSGNVLEIEKRLRRSIDRTAHAGGIDLRNLPSRASIGWPSAETLAKALGPAAYPAYRMGSASLHGTWHDLLRNYLEEVEGGFRPRFEPLIPRPQPLFAGALLLIVATKAYLGTRPAADQAALGPLLEHLNERVDRADALHEAMIQKNSARSSMPLAT